MDATIITILTSLCASSIIGIGIGLLGAGGSLLIMPVLVYILGMTPSSATTYSLGIVGISSLFAALRMQVQKNPPFNIIASFSICSMLSALCMRSMIAYLPETFSFGVIHMRMDSISMIVLAIMMFISAYGMIFTKEIHTNDQEHSSLLMLSLLGALVGALTGFTGIGGGFIIVPVMVLYGKMAISDAVYTSMIVIAMNAIPSFMNDCYNGNTPDWILFGLLTISSILGGMIGIKISIHIHQEHLRRIFGIIILGLSFFIIFNELI